MESSDVRQIERWLLPAVLIGAVVAGVLGATVASADDVPPECAASAESLSEARTAYEDACTLPRIDCDEIDDVWYCSSRVIGDAAPGGVSVEDVAASGISTGTGISTTVVVTAPPPVITSTIAAPSTTTTEASTPTTAPPTTEAPTTTGPPTTAPTATAPATTVPATTAPPTTAAPTTVLPSTTEAPVTTPTTSGTGEVQRVSYPKNDGPDRNPMKGWNSGWSDDRQESTVGFQYIKWQDLEPQNGSFDFDAVEEVISRSGSRDRHVTLRLYCDWWGQNETSRGCPEWIYSQVGVDRIKGDNGRYITDYNDPRYVEEAIQAIQALAQRYDDDPRIYSIQIGVLGYWGEWHTWGSLVDGEQYEIAAQTETAILNAYRDAFDRVHLMARYPDRSILATADDIGFHNDYFRPDNGHSAEFDDAVSSGERWRGGPIGGEIPPGLSSGDYNQLYATSQGREMIEKGHYSTMKPSSVDSRYLGQHLELHKRFGYNYQIDEARFANEHSGSGAVNVELEIANIGIAPFYYDWQVQFALLAPDGQAVALAEAESYDLQRYLPGDMTTLKGNVPLSAATAGDYRLAVRIIQPGADQQKQEAWKLSARNTYILFANDMPVIDGAWSGGNQLIGGWSVLGPITVR